MLCDLYILDGLIAKVLGAHTPREHGNICCGVIVEVVYEGISLRVELTCLVVRGDDDHGLGVVERVLHKARDSLIKAYHSKVSLIKIVIVAMLVDMRLLVHEEEAVLVLGYLVESVGDVLFDSLYISRSIVVEAAVDDCTVCAYELRLSRENAA